MSHDRIKFNGWAKILKHLSIASCVSRQHFPRDFTRAAPSMRSMVLVRFGVAVMMHLVDVHVQMRMPVE